MAAKLPAGPLGSLADAPFTLGVLRRSGVVHLQRPDHLARIGLALARWGASPAAGITRASIAEPDRVGLIDELGELSFGELHARSNALANSLHSLGVGASDGIAIMCRNHRGFFDAVFAAAKLGADVLLMNTAFAGPQLAAVVEREDPAVLIYDSEFAELLSAVPERVRRVIAWEGEGETGDDLSARELIETGSRDNLRPPAAPSRFIVLTSGTTGTPKGAQRSSPETLAPIAALLDRIPLRRGETTVIAAPLFHSWGFLHFSIGLALGSRYVLQRRFDPEATLRAVAESGATALAVVPVMMQRIIELSDETLARYDISSLRITAASGSALPGELAIRWMDALGDNIYNLYGSTEVAYASIATPADLRAAPGTAGRPPHGTVVKIVDEDGSDLPQGEVGRIFVGNQMAFEGYTGGGGKELLAGLMSSGDVGHFDSEGRLFVDGRDDEMIVSGGENVFPREVEDLLSDHPAVEEAAVIGVPDEKFGQRLKAFVVLRDGVEQPDHAALQEYVKAHLARYKVPREVAFLDQLPRNATGKVLKRELS